MVNTAGDIKKRRNNKIVRREKKQRDSFMNHAKTVYRWYKDHHEFGHDINGIEAIEKGIQAMIDAWGVEEIERIHKIIISYQSEFYEGLDSKAE